MFAAPSMSPDQLFRPVNKIKDWTQTNYILINLFLPPASRGALGISVARSRYISRRSEFRELVAGLQVQGWRIEFRRYR